MINYAELKTEMRNPASDGLDTMSTSEILNLFYEEDRKVVEAVKAEHKNIEKVIEYVDAALQAGGRVFYAGAGTSGRLGVLDASEIKPTFGVRDRLFIGIIAGGRRALTNSVEGAEDDGSASPQILKKLKFGANVNDMLIGVTASGVTPFVLGALLFSKESGCRTALITCNKKAGADYAGRFDAIVAPDIGSEIISGSTRLKSGTATKMILNMISSISMIKKGKVYQNYMVDLTPTCKKLVERGCRIISDICGVGRDDAEAILKKGEMNVKTAILMHEKGLALKEAREKLKKCGGFLRQALKK